LRDILQIRDTWVAGEPWIVDGSGEILTAAKEIDGEGLENRVTEDISKLKQEAAERAVDYLKSGMVVGLGHGSTAVFAVKRIAQLLKTGELSNILGVPCSLQIGDEARGLGIPLTTLEEHPIIDMTIDGADEVDPNLELIKGGGGALLREKIVAQASLREIIVVDESKLSPSLGTKWPVPVEVVPFGLRSQVQYLESLSAHVIVRQAGNGMRFTTEQGNLILDCDFGPIVEPEKVASKLEGRAGIVEHGLFLGLATDAIVANAKGIRHLTRDT
jgi:ribose 5-phosphate isomerase A